MMQDAELQPGGDAAGPIHPGAVPSRRGDVDDLLIQQLGLEGRRDSVVAKIALTLAREIIEGRAPASGDLNSLDLAKRFESSRTPPREAPMILMNNGLVDIPPRRRPRVATLTRGVTREIYLLRAELHAVAARRIAENPVDLSAIETALDAMRTTAAAGNLSDYFWANVHFHENVTTATGDTTLKRALDGLGLRVLRLRHLSMSQPGRIQRSFSDHDRMMIAVREGDAILAAAMNRSIVMSALGVLLAILPDSDDSAASMDEPLSDTS